MATCWAVLTAIWRKTDLMILAVSVLVWGTIGLVWGYVVVPWRWWGSLAGLFWTILFSVLATGTVVSWYRAMLLDPGAVPKGWIPPALRGCTEAERADKVAEYLRQPTVERSKKKYVQLEEPEFRWCKLCQGFKPERTHHCRECQRCVLMMDHHCPWVNNCVGHRNRKDFVQFLFFATTSMLTAFGIHVALVVHWVRTARVQPPTLWSILVIALDMVLLLAVSLAVGGLLWYQLSCVSENLTTIDEYVMERQLRAARKLKKAYRWAYDLGFNRNWWGFFGPSVVGWFVPGHTPPLGDGIAFEKRDE